MGFIARGPVIVNVWPLRRPAAAKRRRFCFVNRKGGGADMRPQLQRGWRRAKLRPDIAADLHPGH